LAFVKRHGIVLQAARGPVPSLAEAVVGGAIRGSWWAHAKGSEIYAVADAISESNDVLVCKLVDGKVTYVHRRLWPALVKLAARFPKERLAKIWNEHTVGGAHRSLSIGFPDWVPGDVTRAAKLLSQAEAERALAPLVGERQLPATAAEGPQALRALMVAIAARDAKAASRLLKKSPELATSPATVGATRQQAREHFLEPIEHYVYAGDTALHVAAAASAEPLAKLLISKGANVHARNRRGAEPLHYATDGSPGSSHWDAESQAAVVSLLIEAGADPNAPDKTGVAPLHRAVRTRAAAAVQALLAGGANVNLRNKSGSTPLQLAEKTTGRSGSGSVAAREQQQLIVELLLKAGARRSR
jgi:hypothetical protein